jgi:ABC-2 type transport system permease protein
MTDTDVEPGPADAAAGLSTDIRARRAGFVADVISVAGRAVRSIPREPESVIPALIVPLFFFVVNLGSLQEVAERLPGIDFKAFQLPVAIVFAVTGVSRASTLVTDIQDGYFDRLTLTPIRRPALLLGLMVADFVLVVALSVPVLILGFAVGVRFETGLLGVVAFILLAGAWGLVFTGFPYAIALKTGNPGAVNSSFVLFFPFAFLTTAFLPKEALTSWLDTVATYNPVTYLLDALRSLITEGWELDILLKGMGAVAAVGVVSFSLAMAAFRGRLKAGA